MEFRGRGVIIREQAKGAGGAFLSQSLDKLLNSHPEQERASAAEKSDTAFRLTNSSFALDFNGNFCFSFCNSFLCACSCDNLTPCALIYRSSAKKNPSKWEGPMLLWREKQVFLFLISPGDEQIAVPHPHPPAQPVSPGLGMYREVAFLGLRGGLESPTKGSRGSLRQAAFFGNVSKPTLVHHPQLWAEAPRPQ